MPCVCCYDKKKHITYRDGANDCLVHPTRNRTHHLSANLVGGAIVRHARFCRTALACLRNLSAVGRSSLFICLSLSTNVVIFVRIGGKSHVFLIASLLILPGCQRDTR